MTINMRTTGNRLQVLLSSCVQVLLVLLIPAVVLCVREAPQFRSLTTDEARQQGANSLYNLISDIASTWRYITDEARQQESAVDSSEFSAINRAIRIMPTGDSITLGVGSADGLYTGYRSFLAEELHSLFAWDYVGPKFNVGNHAAYNGQTIQQISEVIGDAVARHQPDVLLLMAGTNDFFWYDNHPTNPDLGCNASVAVTRMTALLSHVFSNAPEAHVLLSGVTYINATLCELYPTAPWNPPACPSDMQQNIEEFNTLLPALAANFTSAGSRVTFHDPNDNKTGCHFEDGDYFTYGIHFSESGYKKIALWWARVLEEAFGKGAHMPSEICQPKRG